MLDIVDEELMAEFVTGVAETLHGLRFQKAPLIAEASEFQLIRPNVLGEVACGDTRRSAFKHGDLNPALGEFLGNPASTGTGADDEDLVNSAGGHEAASLAKRIRIAATYTDDSSDLGDSD
jgi:hypothetical protein